MAEFNLDRFKYNWVGDWVGSNNYNRDDIVRVNGKSYVCLETHTSNADFNADLEAIVPDSNPPVPRPRWKVMTDGRSFIGSWVSGTQYQRGDIILFNGSLYFAIKGHVAGSFDEDRANWELFSDGIQFKQDWAQSVGYSRGAIVRYGGNNYKCITAHTSQSTLEADVTKWELYFNGIEYRFTWSADQAYKKDDLVQYGGTIWRCIKTHDATAIFDDVELFQIEFPGFQYDGEYNAFINYQVGDVVRFGGYLYQANANNVGILPTTDFDSSPVWSLLAKTYNFRGDWTATGTYLPGDLVRRGGDLLQANDYIQFVDDGSTGDEFVDYLDAEKWSIVSQGQNWRGNWEQLEVYQRNDVVIFQGSSYICTVAHTANARNWPGDNGNGIFNWELLHEEATPSGMATKGDLLTYDLSRTLVNDGSTLGPTAVPIGNPNEVLSIDETDSVIWRKYSEDDRVVYVSVNGRDRPGRGLDPFRPFRTIRYALAYAEDFLSRDIPTKIKVATGRYEEECPMVVPSNTVVMGDELRATTIQANNPYPLHQDGDEGFMFSALARLTQLLPQIFTNQPAPFVSTVRDGFEQTFLPGQDASSGESTYVADLSINLSSFVNFSIGGTGLSPNVSATNTKTTDTLKLNAAELLYLNSEFLIEDAYQWLLLNELDYTPRVEEEHIKRHLRNFLRGFRYDLLYPGNFQTIQEARKYVNALNGSQLEDMFYVRDVTGVRNCTVEGLKGALNPPGTFDLYQRPTGGAYVSLDPGWGPEDERTWILTRSPYIQGVTTIGTACVGQKIDGALHAGGNKSCTSNDFTQVLSDGIGAWILNNARAELVSVFTYYNQVGYLAENGGIIRATNGNNSYGSFGAIADGIDANEVPQQATINTRQNEAIVGSTFAGDFSDEILIFEYSHCGEEYNNATASITGSGAQADARYESTRDGAIFQARLINPLDSGFPGGSGYTQVGNNAQTGGLTSITISGNDDNTENEYIGQRIVITSGPGTGQYAEISAYDNITKIVNVRRESDGTAGWDHVVPGKPIETLMTTATVYRIEPKVTVDAPPFEFTLNEVPNSRFWEDVVWGDTTDTFPAIEIDNGSGAVIDAPITKAVFTIEKKGLNYSAVNIVAGSGYAVGDQFTILGTALDGATPANDCVITITEVTEDSTSSIVDFTVFGTARSGRWVAIAQPNYYAYSIDGVNWVEETLPAVREWHTLASGDDIFVAIARDSDRIGYSKNGTDWRQRNIGIQRQWADVVYGGFGGGRFVMIAENSNDVLWSNDGFTWGNTTIPDATGDSTTRQWQKIAYGQGKYLALSGTLDGAIATSVNGIDWTVTTGVIPGGHDWAGVAYGNNMWVALDRNSDTYYYSMDGETWTGATAPTDPTTGGVDPYNWKRLRYANGLFVAVGDAEGKDHDVNGDGSGNIIAVSEDGLQWQYKEVSQNVFNTIAYGNPSEQGKGYWMLMAQQNDLTGAVKINMGKRALMRVTSSAGVISDFKIWDPGSGYSTAEGELPAITVYDNSATVEVFTEKRIGNKVLPQPSFINRGIGYRTSSTRVAITGDGYADIIPEANEIFVDGVAVVPGPGAQLLITGIIDPDTQQTKIFVATRIEDAVDDGTNNGTFRFKATISPSLENKDNVRHSAPLAIRANYSQCRISGHDFLDIGTGNFEETNYPDLYAGGAYFLAAPENEVYEQDGGRVFYTSTDQDGNFRTGELFSVEQATGIVTISAEFFDLDGLSELALGGVRLGGSGTVIREFSTDVNFTEDSNNVIPTQRAVATFLATRLSEGGSELETNQLVAGVVILGSDENIIDTTTDVQIDLPKIMNIEGTDANISGSIVAQGFFLRQEIDSNGIF